jgi:DNA-directed RNA polymerase-3 subunit RPC5
MTVKSNIDGEEDTSDTMAQRITAAQTEEWKTHRFIDEDEAAAWDVYKESLFVGHESANQDRSESLAKLPKLQSLLDDADYLDEISAPRDAAKLSRSKKISQSKKGKEKETAETVESDSSTLSDSSEDETEVVAPV